MLIPSQQLTGAFGMKAAYYHLVHANAFHNTGGLLATAIHALDGTHGIAGWR
jgi:hypothetical protein